MPTTENRHTERVIYYICEKDKCKDALSNHRKSIDTTTENSFNLYLTVEKVKLG